MPLRLKAGDDASCLNLYQPGRPRILGVPPALVDRGGFRFRRHRGENRRRTCESLAAARHSNSDGAIPVFGEQHSVQWMLKSGLGGVIEVPDEQGRPVKLRIVGLLKDSVFQSELLMSGSNFKALPAAEGFRFFA